MDSPKFSIIAPVYKVAKYLPLFFECIDKQTFEDYELILVDDGSPDDSGKLCDDYAAKNQHARVIHKPNGGVSSARNTGLDNAMGEWILFYDPDDTVPHNALETINNTLVKNSDAQVLLYNYNIVNHKGERISTDSRLPYDILLDRSGVQRHMLCSMFNGENVLRSPWTKAFRRSLIDEYHFRFTQRTFAEDYEFNLKLFLHVQHAIAIRDCLYDYWQHPGTAVGRYHDGILGVWLEDTKAEIDIYIECKDYVGNESLNRYCNIAFSSLCHHLQATAHYCDDAKNLITELVSTPEYRFVSNGVTGCGNLLMIVKNALDSTSYYRIKPALLFFRKYCYLKTKLSKFKNRLA